MMRMSVAVLPLLQPRVTYPSQRAGLLCREGGCRRCPSRPSVPQSCSQAEEVCTQVRLKQIKDGQICNTKVTGPRRKDSRATALTLIPLGISCMARDRLKRSPTASVREHIFYNHDAIPHVNVQTIKRYVS